MMRIILMLESVSIFKKELLNMMQMADSTKVPLAIRTKSEVYEQVADCFYQTET